EIRWPEIDGGKSRVRHNQEIRTRNDIRLRDDNANDNFKKEIGRAWDVIKRRQVKEAREAADRLKEAERRERDALSKRQAQRAAEEHAADERRRPKGLRGMFLRIVGKKAKIEAELARAKRRRMDRDQHEWEKLEERQSTQRQRQETDLKRRFEQEKLLFRVEAKRIHEQMQTEPTQGRSTDHAQGRDKSPPDQREDDEERARGEGRGHNLGR
ncbi:MAG: hypothetical protein CL484_00490, partial [Acidobacteria bacterium]|nr:hypothetical protein [Acidobacteriota bacterium]